MKHDWEQPYKPPGWSNAQVFMAEPLRRCRNCHACQQLYAETAWGRIVSRRWMPLAGRCMPKAQQ